MPTKELRASYILDASGIKKGVSEADKSLSGLSGSAKKMGGEFDKQTSRVGGAFTSLGNTLGNWGLPFSNSLTKVGTSLDKAKSTGKGYGQVLSDVGRVASGVLAGGLVAVGAESIHLAANFQTSMTELVTGAGESESAIGQVSKGIKNMAGAVGMGPQQLAAGMYMIESAGYHGAEGLKVLRAAAEGAKVGGADMATVADGLTTALNDYRLPASQAALVTSQLVATVASGKTHMQDLAGALATVLPAASSAHVGLAQVLGAMATMTAKGTPAADAATYLRMTILKLSAPSAAASKQMAELGLSSVDVAEHLGSRGLTGTMALLTHAIAAHTSGGLVWMETMQKQSNTAAQLAAATAKLGQPLTAIAQGYDRGSVSTAKYRAELAKLSPEEQRLVKSVAALTLTQDANQTHLKGMSKTAETVTAALANMVGGARSMQAALELTGGSASTFNQNVHNIGATTTDAGGHVQGFSKVQKDLNFQIDQAKAQAESLGITFGQFLIPKLEDVMHWTATTVSWFEKHKAAAIALGAVIAGPLSLAMGAFAVNKIAGMVKGIGQAATELGKFEQTVVRVAQTVLTKAGVIKTAAADQADSVSASAKRQATSVESSTTEMTTKSEASVTGMASTVEAESTGMATKVEASTTGMAAGVESRVGGMEAATEGEMTAGAAKTEGIVAGEATAVEASTTGMAAGVESSIGTIMSGLGAAMAAVYLGKQAVDAFGRSSFSPGQSAAQAAREQQLYGIYTSPGATGAPKTGPPVAGGAGGGVERMAPPKRQGGGPVGAGEVYIVGESGAEYFLPGASGMIVPQGSGFMGSGSGPVAATAAGTGTGTVNVTLNLTIAGSGIIYGSPSVIARELAPTIRTALLQISESNGTSGRYL